MAECVIDVVPGLICGHKRDGGMRDVWFGGNYHLR